MNTAVLCLGSNLGFRIAQLELAKSQLEGHVGPITKQSAYYETAPWGSQSKFHHINQCVIVETKLSAKHLLKQLLKIELHLGRNRGSEKNADRLIDIDILFFNDSTIQTKELELPHPRLHLRRFVLKPLLDICPNWKHPVLNKTINSLYKSCKDKLSVVAITPKPIFVCIEGNIGSGKSTLANALANQLNAHFLPEQFEKNALLPLFYKDKQTFGFPLEYSFLIQRFQQLHDYFLNPNEITISDYSIYKCVLFAKLNLPKKEYAFYAKHFEAILKQLPQPDFIIVLQTSTQHLKTNIKNRGRVYEKNMATNYLDSISALYKSDLKKVFKGNCLNIEVSNYSEGTLEKLLIRVQNSISL
jgi:deoxyguanosine kinase